MAATAATKHTKEDIIKELDLKSPEIHEASFVRENIAYRIFKPKPRKNYRILQNTTPSTGIIYCQTRKSVKEVSSYLIQKNILCQLSRRNGQRRAGKSDEFLDGRIFKNHGATNAFSIGIDKPNVRFVIHYEIGESIEAYFQEAGRAGRDQKAMAMLL